MSDFLMQYGPQFATITALAMIGAQLLPLKWLGKHANPNGSTVLERNGTRRPMSALVYSILLNHLGWFAGVLVHMPDPPAWSPSPIASNIAFLILMSLGSVVTAHFSVKIKKAVV